MIELPRHAEPRRREVQPRRPAERPRRHRHLRRPVPRDPGPVLQVHPRVARHQHLLRAEQRLPYPEPRRDRHHRQHRQPRHPRLPPASSGRGRGRRGSGRGRIRLRRAEPRPPGRHPPHREIAQRHRQRHEDDHHRHRQQPPRQQHPDPRHQPRHRQQRRRHRHRRKDPPGQPVRHSAARGPRPAEKPSPLTPSITPNGCVLLSGTARFSAHRAKPVGRCVVRGTLLPRVFPSRRHGGWS